MAAIAPQAIYNLWYAIHRDLPKSQLGGIVGDTAHSFGYHLARHDLPASDYSVQLPRDRLGPSDLASALDVTLPPDLMKTCTKRLVDAAKAHDPRLKALREFCGTLNGTDTYPWDLSTNQSEGVGTWDDSHLWHIHLSFYRQYADNETALLPIADVLAGKPLSEEFTVTPEDEKKIHDLIAESEKRIDERIDRAVNQLTAVVGRVIHNTDGKHPNALDELGPYIRGEKTVQS